MLELIGPWSNFAVALIAIIALFYAHGQIRISREIGARQAYERYHELLLDHPEYISAHKNVDDLDDEQFFLLETFVLYTLMIDERLYEVFHNKPGWINSIEDDIRININVIKCDRFADQLENQNWTIKHLILKIMRE